MNERRQFRKLPGFFDQPDAVYMIQRRALMVAIIAGLITGLILFTPLAGFAVFVLLWSIGTLWRREEPPVLVYCVAYQWLFVAIGYFYNLLTGEFPFQDIPLGDLQGATFLSLIGFICIVLGIRLGLKLTKADSLIQSKSEAWSLVNYDVRLLFWGVIGIYTVNWFFEVAPRQIAFNQAQLISTILSARDVLFCALLLSVIQQRRGYRYLIAASIFVLLPQSISQHSSFSWIFIFVVLAVLKDWRPWSKTPADRQRNWRIALASLAIGVTLVFMALVWQGGVKENWRSTLRTEHEVKVANPIDKLGALADVIENVYSELSWSEALDSLAARMSGTFYFSHTLLHVPAAVPHENGRLTMRAIEHTVKPRFLFPDKADLGSNSWLIWQYTGLPAAGEESETSIGLTYMAQFYVDFGPYLMFVPLFVWGLIIGAIYGLMFRLAPSRLLASATVMVLFPQPFSSFEGEIAYLLGGLIQSAIVFGVLLHFLGPLGHRRLLNFDRKAKRLRPIPSSS